MNGAQLDYRDPGSCTACGLGARSVGRAFNGLRRGAGALEVLVIWQLCASGVVALGQPDVPAWLFYAGAPLVIAAGIVGACWAAGRAADAP